MTQNSEFDIGYVVNEINTADLLSNQSTTTIEPKTLAFKTKDKQLITHKVFREMSDSSLSSASHLTSQSRAVRLET